MDDEPTLSTQMVANILELSPRTIINLVLSKRLNAIPAMKGSRYVLRYRQSDIDAFISEQQRILAERMQSNDNE